MNVDKWLIEKMGWLALAYVLLWLLASFTHYGFGLDVVEGLVWGKEWLIGTYKHPPLPTWILEIAWQLGGRLGVNLVLPVLQVLSMWVLYLFAKNFVGREKALLSTLLVGICFAWRAFDGVLNHNTAQLIFWVLTIYLFYRALENKKLLYWIMLGIVAAGCFWVKYSAVFLLLCIPIWLLSEKSARANLKTFAPWSSLAVFLLLIAPHIYFLVDSNFQPIEYSRVRSNYGNSPLKFLAGQLLTQAPFIIILALTGFFGAGCFSFKLPLTKDEKFILYFAFVPLFLFVLSLTLAGVSFHTQWGYSFLPLMGLVAIKFIGGRFDKVKFKKAFYALLILFAFTPLTHIAYITIRPYVYNIPSKLNYPQQDLAVAVENIFVKETGKPPALLIGRIDIAGRASLAMSQRPQTLIEGSWKKSPWVDRKTACGATAIVWQAHRPFAKKYKQYLRHCGVKKPKIHRFKVPFPSYPNIPPLDLKMIIVNK